MHYYSPLKDADGMQPFTIGGVNGDGPSTHIDAIITYKTPYVIHGRPVLVTFALGNSIATNSIVSFPFLQSIKATIMFENMTMVSAMLGESFKIDSMVPLRADAAPAIPQDTSPTFVTPVGTQHAAANNRNNAKWPPPSRHTTTSPATAEVYLLDTAPN